MTSILCRLSLSDSADWSPALPPRVLLSPVCMSVDWTPVLAGIGSLSGLGAFAAAMRGLRNSSRATESAARAQQLSNLPSLYNEYGPTEAVVGCVVHRLQPGERGEGAVPIGRPAPGTRAYVVGAGLEEAVLASAPST